MIGNELNRSDPRHLGLTAKQSALVSGGQEALFHRINQASLHIAMLRLINL